MQTVVQKWGNSLALRIPKVYATDLGIEQGCAVDVVLADGCLVVRPLTAPRYELADLLEGVDETNLHAEVDLGSPVGAEEW